SCWARSWGSPVSGAGDTKRACCQILAAASPGRDLLALAPFLEQRLAPARITRGFRGERGDPVDAEIAEIGAQLAPGRDDTHAVEEAERKGPDRAPGLGSAAVAIGDVELALGADRLSDGAELRVARRDGLARRHEERRGLERIVQIGRENRGDLGQRV